jgi:hypothetical protein
MSEFMATKRFETEKLGMDGGECDLVVSEVSPVDGFEWCVAQEFAGVGVEVVRWIGQSGELERGLRGDEPHALIGKMTTFAKHGHT